MIRIKLALLTLCAAEALFCTPVTFTSGTLFWAPTEAFGIYDVTNGTTEQPVLQIGGSQFGQMSFYSDLSAVVFTGGGQVRKWIPGQSVEVLATGLGTTTGVVVSPDGRVYASTTGGKVYDVTDQPDVLIANGLGLARNMLWTPQGILLVEQGGHRVLRLKVDGMKPATVEEFATGVIDGKDIEVYNGDIFVSSLAAGVVYNITNGGAMTDENIFATGQQFIGLATANGRLYATNFSDSGEPQRIFDITNGGKITELNAFGPVLPGKNETMFDAVPTLAGFPPQDQVAATPEPSSWVLLATGALLIGLCRPRRGKTPPRSR